MTANVAARLVTWLAAAVILFLMLNLRRSLLSGAAFALAGLLCTYGLRAQGITDTVGERAENRGGEGETHLVLTYKCAPQTRAAFRAFMNLKGGAHFAACKQQGALA